MDINNTKLEVRAKLTMPDGMDIPCCYTCGGEHSVAFDFRFGVHQTCRLDGERDQQHEPNNI